jgi:hypothetical protein
MPRDHTFEHLDHKQRGDRFVLQDCFGGMAKAQSAHDDVDFAA